MRMAKLLTVEYYQNVVLRRFGLGWGINDRVLARRAHRAMRYARTPLLAPVVKWISQQSSELSFQVRVLAGALERRGTTVLLSSRATCGYGLVVKRVLAKDESGVRFSLSAPNKEHPTRGVFCLGEGILYRSHLVLYPKRTQKTLGQAVFWTGENWGQTC